MIYMYILSHTKPVKYGAQHKFLSFGIFFLPWRKSFKSGLVIRFFMGKEIGKYLDFNIYIYIYMPFYPT